MKIGSYQTIDKLSENKYGAVYLGEEPDSRELVLLRLIRATKQTATDLVRFRHEFERRRDVKDPRIVPLLEIIAQDDMMGLVTAGVEEVALQEYCRRFQGGLDLNGFLSMAINLVQSIEILHTHDIVHGAIKPTDIFFNIETHFTN